MKLTLKSLIASVVVAVALLSATSLQAGLLSYAANAYNDGLGPGAGGAWYGTAPYSDSLLTGSIQWIVFDPTKFTAALGGNGYSAQPHELIYAYEIENTGGSDLSTFDADIVDGRPYDTVGWFTDPTQAGHTPTTFIASPSSPFNFAHYFFSGGIPSGASSVGLAYSSPNAPELGFGSVVNSGLSDNPSIPAPSTAPAQFPEPSTLVLLLFAGLSLCLRSRLAGPLARILSFRHT